MTCVCGSQFCFKCGGIFCPNFQIIRIAYVSPAPWNNKKCSRGSGCELWEDEDMLLDEERRHRHEPLDVPGPAPPVALVDAPPAPAIVHPVAEGDFNWIDSGKK